MKAGGACFSFLSVVGIAFWAECLPRAAFNRLSLQVNELEEIVQELTRL